MTGGFTKSDLVHKEKATHLWAGGVDAGGGTRGWTREGWTRGTPVDVQRSISLQYRPTD
ncbi:hypothetical protein GCM10009745_68420 [Kribbella yunnanensis]|uniref:Uncharacterized protein n=1 Tax=Kribbella yunnanensis TaxID=190194 RepID=A0ABP4UW65_9ACTN